FTGINLVRDFIGDNKVIVAGSTWEGDETVLTEYIKQNKSVKLIIAPHEIHQKHIDSIITLFHNPVLYSSIASTHVVDTNTEGRIINNPILSDTQVLIIDSVGMLSRLYAYATVTYVGGGFTKDGIHNI